MKIRKNVKKPVIKKEYTEQIYRKKMSAKARDNLTFIEVIAASIALGFLLFLLNTLLFSAIPEVSSIINMLALVIIIGTPLLFKYAEHKKIREIEETFPKFLNHITENIKTGMTLPQAFRAVATNEYGALSPFVKEMSAKMSFGIPFEDVILDFARKTHSENMNKNVELIIETHRSGGTVVSILDAVGDSLRELEKLKKQRTSSVYSQMLNGYIIYVIFLGIMIGLSSFLLPTFQEDLAPELRGTFIELFSTLIVVQGFFSGLAIGKLSEGTMLAGVKHSLILIIFGWSAFVIFG